jgi:hypothetical protein
LYCRRRHFRRFCRRIFADAAIIRFTPLLLLAACRRRFRCMMTPLMPLPFFDASADAAAAFTASAGQFSLPERRRHAFDCLADITPPPLTLPVDIFAVIHCRFH